MISRPRTIFSVGEIPQFCQKKSSARLKAYHFRRSGHFWSHIRRRRQQPGQLAVSAAHVQHGSRSRRGEPPGHVRVHVVVVVLLRGQETVRVVVVVPRSGTVMPPVSPGRHARVNWSIVGGVW
jgi:hypothetical protein